MVGKRAASCGTTVATSRPVGGIPPIIGLVALMIALMVVLALALGCGRGKPQLAPVAGIVTWAGSPVPRGTVVFYPAEGRPALGKIGTDGSYSLTTFQAGDGAALGLHRVTIEATRGSDVAAPASFEEESRGGYAFPPSDVPPTQWLVPQQYSTRETSPLTATVAPGLNHIDFRLPTTPAATKKSGT